MANMWLRCAALFGAVAVVAITAIQSSSEAAEEPWGALVVLLGAAVAAIAVRVLMPGAGARLRRHPNLIVPLGLVTLADAALGWLLAVSVLSAILSPSLPLSLAGLSFSLSGALAIGIAIHVAYAAWTTSLVLSCVREDRSDLAATLKSVRGLFWRTLAVESIGTVMPLVFLAIGMAATPAVGAPAIVGIGVATLVWNVATAAVLPVTLTRGGRILDALRDGMKESWAARGRVWKPVVAQLLILGFVTFYSASVSRWTIDPETGAQEVTTREHSSWNVHAFWTGGYADECHWYDEVADALETKPVGVFSALLTLVMGVLAIAVKLQVVEVIELREREARG